MKSHNVLKTKHLIRKRMISSTRCGVFLVFALIWGFGFVMGVCNFLSSVSSQQKFEATDFTPLGMSQLLDRSVLQLRVTAQFCLEKKIHSRGLRACQPIRWEGRESALTCVRERHTPPSLLAPLFICFFLLPSGPSLYKLG